MTIEHKKKSIFLNIEVRLCGSPWVFVNKKLDQVALLALKVVLHHRTNVNAAKAVHVRDRRQTGACICRESKSQISSTPVGLVGTQINFRWEAKILQKLNWKAHFTITWKLMLATGNTCGQDLHCCTYFKCVKAECCCWSHINLTVT